MNGIVAGLFEKRFHPSQDPPESWSRGGLSESLAGVTVTPESAMGNSAVYACVNVLAQDEAKLPLITYERLERGKRRATDFYLYELLHDMPNPEMTAFDMRQAMQGHLGLRGNAFAEIVYDGSGRIAEIWPLRPDKMRLKRTPSGALVYVYNLPASLGGSEMMYRPEEIWHIRGLSSQGLWGLSPIMQAMQSIGLAMAAEGYGARLFANDARASFVLTHPGELSDNAYKRLLQSWEDRHKGWDSSHRVAILEEGMKPEQIGIAPDEAQFLETRKFQTREIARFYRMQPHKIQDLEQATFSNIEHQSIEYVVDTLGPYLTNWEQSIQRCLLLKEERRRYFVEHLVEGLLRGDTLSRYEAYGQAINAGWMMRNEPREKENMNPIEGLDEPLMPLNMATVDQAAAKAKAEVDAGSGSRNDQREGEAEGSIVKRDSERIERLKRSYRRIFVEAGQRIVRREVNDVRNAARKHLQSGNLAAFSAFLNDFYGEHSRFMTRNLAPLAQSYLEMGGEKRSGEEIEARVAVAMGRISEKHCLESRENLNKCVSDDLDDDQNPLDEVEEELNRWADQRSGEIADACARLLDEEE